MKRTRVSGNYFLIPKTLVDIETGDERTCQDGNTPAPERDTTAAESHPVATQQENLISTDIFDVRLDSGDEGELIGEERTDEEIVVRSLSDEPLSVTSPQQRPLEPQLLEEHIEVDEPMAESLDTESEGDSSDESDLSVVKIVSDDPWAAARAAAIAGMSRRPCSHLSPLILSAA